MTTMMSTTAETATTALEATTWTVDPSHTTVEFSVKHLMIATVKGRLDAVRGSVLLDPTRPAASRVEVEMDAASIDTGEAKRDEHLRSADFLDVASWPQLRFVGKRVEGDTTRRFRLAGDLTIRGVTREVVLDVRHEGSARDPWGSDRQAFHATTSINRSDFGLRWNVALETGGMLVGEEVRVAIDVELVRQPA
jgi:polyisoprenoid-binding protein YceI